MKTIKLLLAIVLLSSCTQEVIVTEPQNYSIDLSINDNTDKGTYKGLFTTLDSETRGKVSLSIKDHAKGIITLVDGTVISLDAANYVKGSPVTNILFRNSKESRTVVSFSFSVDKDGSNSIIEDVLFNEKESDILIRKETSLSSVTAATGTYTCELCVSPTTFSVITYVDIPSQMVVLDAQVLFNGVVYPSGGIASDCRNGQALGGTFCNIEGLTQIPSGDIEWSGYIFYIDANTTETGGTWIKTNTGTNGTFEND